MSKMYQFRRHMHGGAATPGYIPDTSTGLSWSQRPPQLPRFTCGLSPSTLVKFFAGIDIAKNLLGAVIFIWIYLKFRVADLDEMRQAYADNADMLEYLSCPQWQQKGFILLMIIIFLLGLIFSIVLYRGAKRANYSKLRIWFLYQLIALIAFSAVHIWTFIHGWLLPDRPRKLTGSLFLIFLLNYLWAGYSMYVVYLQMKDISNYAAITSNSRSISNIRMYQQPQYEFR